MIVYMILTSLSILFRAVIVVPTYYNFATFSFDLFGVLILLFYIYV